MHGMSFVVHQLSQCPESILLIKKHEQDSDNLVHAMAVAHLRKSQIWLQGPPWRPPPPSPWHLLLSYLLDGLPFVPGHHPMAPFFRRGMPGAEDQQGLEVLP